jgi:alcohol dehydrogenase
MRITAAVLRNMKAPTPYAESEPIKIETIELAAPGPEEFLIRIRAAAAYAIRTCR